MLEPRVLAGCDEAVDLVFQRRDPGGIVLVDLPREVDEGLLVLLRGDGADGDGAAAHARGLAAVRRARQLRSLRGHDPATISGQGQALQRLMTDTATLERTTNAAPAQRAPARKDDAAMLKAAAKLTRDLNVPNARVYWADMLGSALLGYVALFSAMFVRSTPVALAAGL